VFQCESDGAQRTLRRLKARSVRDLAIANAFFKPGPAMGGMADTFVRRYPGQGGRHLPAPRAQAHPRRHEGGAHLPGTGAADCDGGGGLSWEQADQIRRGMSHFGQAEMAAVQEQFVVGCMRPRPRDPGLTETQARKLWEQIIPFAGYGFNQGHATAYADVSYRSAYLKAHYPAEFLCARLADYGGFHHPVIYMAEAVRLGIRVRPPHVNHSGGLHALADDAAGSMLYMGLGQVRDLRKPLTVAGARLPGWTGGPGFFLTDGSHFLFAHTPKSMKNPPAWKPVVARGRWLQDEWGVGWFQIAQIEPIEPRG
jgi:DNA polymerase III subunit alpha